MFIYDHLKSSFHFCRVIKVYIEKNLLTNKKIDDMIGSSSKGWKTHRLTRLSRSVMRLATYEMLFEEDIPYSVSINEAIELTKKFDDLKAKAFVNGVLNSVKEKIEAQKADQ